MAPLVDPHVHPAPTPCLEPPPSPWAHPIPTEALPWPHPNQTHGGWPMTSWGCGVTWSPWSSLGSKVHLASSVPATSLHGSPVLCGESEARTRELVPEELGYGKQALGSGQVPPSVCHPHTGNLRLSGKEGSQQHGLRPSVGHLATHPTIVGGQCPGLGVGAAFHTRTWGWPCMQSPEDWCPGD